MSNASHKRHVSAYPDASLFISHGAQSLLSLITRAATAKSVIHSSYKSTAWRLIRLRGFYTVCHEKLGFPLLIYMYEKYKSGTIKQRGKRETLLP